MTREEYIERVKRLLSTRMGNDQANLAQALYLLGQSITVIANLGKAVKRAKRGGVINGDYRPVDADRNWRIVDDYRRGMKSKDIAKKYDLSEGRVSHIILRMGGRKYARSRVKRLSDKRDPIGEGSTQDGK